MIKTKSEVTKCFHYHSFNDFWNSLLPNLVRNSYHHEREKYQNLLTWTNKCWTLHFYLKLVDDFKESLGFWKYPTSGLGLRRRHIQKYHFKKCSELFLLFLLEKLRAKLCQAAIAIRWTSWELTIIWACKMFHILEINSITHYKIS